MKQDETRTQLQTILSNLAAKAADGSQRILILGRLENLAEDLRQELKAERLGISLKWAESVPSFDEVYRVVNQRQIIGKNENIRFSKGVPDLQTMAALNAAAKDPDCVLILKTKEGYRKVKKDSLESSHVTFTDLLPDMDERTRTTFENAKARYNFLVIGANLVPETVDDVTFLD